MSDMDALVEATVESLAHAVYARTGQNPFRDALTEDVTIALRHVGLPALLERVEAAEGARAKPTTWSTGLRRLENLLADEWGDDLAITYETFCTAYRSARAFESDNTERADFRTALDASETP